MKLAAWLRARWRAREEAWFGPADARVLAICRILLFWHVLSAFRLKDYVGFAAYERWAWYPVGVFRAWSIRPPSALGLEVVSYLAWGATLLALLGLGYRFSAPVAALLTLFLRGLPNNFGKVDHGENLLVLALLVFSLARAADAWSVDAWWRRRRGASPVEASGHYTWPRRFVLLLIVTMYSAAGASKLIATGWDWAFSDSFRLLLLRHHFTHHPPTQIGVWIADYPTLCRLLALGSLLAELAGVLALLGVWLQRLIVPVLFALQLGIWMLMGVRVGSMLTLFMCLLPWQLALGLLDHPALRRFQPNRTTRASADAAAPPA